MDKKKRLIFDFDGVIVAEEAQWLNIVNRFLKIKKMPAFDVNYHFETYSFLKDEIFKGKPDLFKEFLEFYATQSKFYYKGLPMIDGAIEGLEKLSKPAHISIATASLPYSGIVLNPHQFAEKVFYVDENMPFLPRGRCNAVQEKDMLHGHAMIDDNPLNFEGHFAHRFLFTRSYNKDVPQEELDKKGIVRVKDWPDLVKKIERTL